MSGTLEGKVALVTGASSGIGAAVARALVSRGARVTLLARRLERLESLAVELREGGGEALPIRADVTSEEELCDAFDVSQRHFGRLDILINNAGIGRSAPLLTGATADWREMLEVNVLALIVCAREAVKRFHPAGHVVNIASLSAHRVPPSGGLYPATKFAVRAITEALRVELHSASNKTRVTQISPGFVATEFSRGYQPEEQAKLEARLDEIKILDAEDVAASVLHCLEAPEHVAIHDILMRPREQGN